MDRTEALEFVADLVARQEAEPIRVAIDGMDAAGKTTLADELLPLVERQGRRVIRSSIDDFQRPQAERYRRGPESPEGYYYDSFDHDAVREYVLRLDSEAILLFDGVFLLRPELNDLWNLRVFVDVEPQEALQRSLARDVQRFGSADAARLRYARRYIPGQQLYLEAVQPKQLADVVFENTNPASPSVS